MGVGSIQYGKVLGAGCLLDDMLCDLIGDVLSLVFCRCITAQSDLGTIRTSGDEHLGLAMNIARDQRVGRRKDLWSRAVVILKTNNRKFGIVPFEIQNVSDVRSTPPIDRLIGISSDIDVGMIDR